MPAPQKHRQAIIDAAVTLFRRQGYSATGLSEIVRVSGAPKGSLYYHFPEGKAAIAEQAIREAGERVAATVRGLAETCATSRELLRAHADLLAGWMEQSGYRDGCPITTVLLELSPDHDGVTAAGRASYEARLQALAEKLRGDGLGETAASDLAVLCTAALQGALIQSRVERSGAAITRTAETLAGLLPEPGSAGSGG